MSANSSRPKKNNTGSIIFIGSIVIFVYWLSSQVIDIYRFTATGVVFELLWLPMFAMLFILPVLAFVFWVKERFKGRSLYLYSLLICITTVLVIIFKS